MDQSPLTQNGQPADQAELLLYPYSPAPRIDLMFHPVHGIAMMPPGAVFGPRQLQDNLLVWIIAAPEGSRLMLNDQPFPAVPGQMFLLPPGSRDELRFGRGAPSIHAFCHFQCEMPNHGWPDRSLWPVTRWLREESILPPLFRHLLHILALPTQPRHFLAQNILQLMLVTFITGETAMVRTPRAAFPALVEKTLAHLDQWALERPEEKLTVGDLAQSLHVNPDHLSRQFKKAVGVGPAEYLMSARLERGATLLRDTEETVESIAELCGFYDQSHFSRVFKREMNYTPTEFRRLASLHHHAMRPLAAMYLPYLSSNRGKAQGIPQLIKDIRDGDRLRETVNALRQWNQRKFEAAPSPTAEPDMLDLSSQANRTASNGPGGWFGDQGLEPVPEGTVEHHGIPFKIPPQARSSNVFILLGQGPHGDARGVEQLTLTFEPGASLLYLLAAAAWIDAPTQVAARIESAPDDIGGQILAIDSKLGERELQAPWVLTDWWPHSPPVRRRHSLPVLQLQEDLHQIQSCLYVLEIQLTTATRKFTLHAGECPMMILAATLMRD